MHRVLSAPDFREGFVEMLPACIGLVPFGLVCGVGAAAAGIDFPGTTPVAARSISWAAAVVAGFTRSTLKTLAAGMLALWLLQWLVRVVV
jgi:hypothetical protein